MLALTPLVLQLLAAGLRVAPDIVAAAQQELALLRANAAPTPDQQAAIDAALDRANAALQAA